MGGPSEFIDHGLDGFIADPYRPEIVAGYVVRLLDDASLRRTIGENGRARVLSRHGPEAYARTIEAVYADTVLGR
jgi:glycosyltransferase involved in cell wall biosynthesis